MVEICKMCLESKELVRSHLMPAFLYDYCRKGEHSPLRVGGGVMFPTDRQTQDYLLCRDCEDVLNRGGEEWVSHKLATWERTFPLYEIVTKFPPIFDTGGIIVHAGSDIPELKVDQLIHFALGIFWKASVHSWMGDSADPRIKLGLYSEKLRRWLRGETEFPANVHLIVSVEKPERAQIIILDPYEGVHQGWRTHFMHVPGVLFMLALGPTVDESVALAAINFLGNPINVSDALTDDFEKLMVSSVRNSRKTHAYFRQ